MTWNKRVRQTHRWLSIVFTVAVLIDTVVAVTVPDAPVWVYLLPVPPVLLLMASGLYLFALPYRSRRLVAREA
jgi:archaellum biogenesis protein FlaJ (TadC family)